MKFVLTIMMALLFSIPVFAAGDTTAENQKELKYIALEKKIRNAIIKVLQDELATAVEADVEELSDRIKEAQGALADLQKREILLNQLLSRAG